LKLLEEAFKEAAKLTEIEQNALAKWVLEELESDKQWNQAFAGSENVLEKLADETLNEYKQGKTKPWYYIFLAESSCQELWKFLPALY
jgi:hypothetical protein